MSWVIPKPDRLVQWQIQKYHIERSPLKHNLRKKTETKDGEEFFLNALSQRTYKGVTSQANVWRPGSLPLVTKHETCYVLGDFILYIRVLIFSLNFFYPTISGGSHDPPVPLPLVFLCLPFFPFSQKQTFNSESTPFSPSRCSEARHCMFPARFPSSRGQKITIANAANSSLMQRIMYNN